MRIAIVSDIHGNRHAFEAVLAAADAERPDAVWCLGDVVGYGADPNACVALAREHTHLCLAGNHDLAVRGDLPLAQFSELAALAAAWTQGVIEPEPLTWLRSLEPEQLDQPVGLFHASPRDAVWEYVVSASDGAECLAMQEHRVCLIGHSHMALSFRRTADGGVDCSPQGGDSELDLAEHEWLLNPGSAGQPRDGDPRAAWMLLDTAAWRAAYRRAPYDVKAAAAAILAAGLPEVLARRLFHGD